MRTLELVFVLASSVSFYGCARTKAGPKALSISSRLESSRPNFQATANAAAPERIEFQTQIKPMLEAHCQPCHFSGGKVYQRMPFDRPETIKTLGTRLFMRIKDENERRLIRDFLAQDQEPKQSG